MSRFGRKVIKRAMRRIVKKALRRKHMRKMIKRGKHVNHLNYAKPGIGGIMLS